MATRIATFDPNMQRSRVWLDELMSRMGWTDSEKACLALRAALHAMRDRLTYEEAVNRSTQVPMPGYGSHYEGWRLAGTSMREQYEKEFLAHVAKALDIYDLGDSEKIACNVFQILAKDLSKGRMDDIRQVLPHELRALVDGAVLPSLVW